MSLLINESYANPSTPLWVPVTGGVIDGNLQVNGNLGVDGTARATLTITSLTGDVEASGSLKGQSVALRTPAGLPTNASISTNGVVPTIMTVASNEIDFGLPATPANTKLTMSLPPPLGVGDVLTVGGRVEMQSMKAGPQMVGTGSIAVGQTNTGIATSAVTASSTIFLSRIGAAALGPGAGAAQGNLTYRPADIIPGVSFTVYLTDSIGVITAASLVDAEFVWMVIN